MAKKKSQPEISSAITLFSQSYEIVMRNIKTFSILFALPFIASLVSTFHNNNFSGKSRWQHLNIFGSNMQAYSIVGFVGLGVVLLIITAVAALLLQAMLTGLEVETAKGKLPELNHLWQLGKKYWLRLLGLGLMVVLYFAMAAVAGLIIFPIFIILHAVKVAVFIYAVWLVFILIFLLVNYYLAPYVLIDQDKPIFDALSESSTLAKKNYFSIASVIVLAMLLGLTGVVPVVGPVISFILGALYSVAPALRYFELKQSA